MTNIEWKQCDFNEIYMILNIKMKVYVYELQKFKNNLLNYMLLHHLLMRFEFEINNKIENKR